MQQKRENPIRAGGTANLLCIAAQTLGRSLRVKKEEPRIIGTGTGGGANTLNSRIESIKTGGKKGGVTEEKLCR